MTTDTSLPTLRLLTGRDDLADAASRALASRGAAAIQRVDISPANRGARPFIAGGAIDVCEIPIVTLLQAIAFDKSVLLLPVTALGRTQHQTLVTRKGLTIDDIPGSTIGVRSWSQTTCLWVRGFLSDEYGIDLRDVNWITYENGHLDEFTDPDWTTRSTSGNRLPEDLLAGAVDFAVLGNELPKNASGISTAIPDPKAAGLAWLEAHGCAPVNHVFAVDADYARAHPQAVLAAFDAMVDIGRTRPHDPVPFEPFGVEGMREPFSLAARYAFEQGVVDRLIAYDEVIARTCEALGVPLERLSPEAR